MKLKFASSCSLQQPGSIELIPLPSCTYYLPSNSDLCLDHLQVMADHGAERVACVLQDNHNIGPKRPC